MELRQRFPKKIRNAMILSYTSSVIIMLSLLGVSLYFLTKRHLEAEMGKRLIAIASITASDIAPWLVDYLQPGSEQNRTLELLRSKLIKATRTGQVRRVYLADLNNHSLVDTDAQIKIGTPYFEHQLYEREISKVRSGIATDTTLFLGQDGLYYKNGLVPIYNSNQKVVAILGVQASADFFQDLTAIQRYLFVAIMIAALIIIAISLLISAKIVTPIHRLIDTTKRIGTGDLQTQILLPSRNEFGLLGASIDDMRRDLLEKDIRMRAMLQGIAHEIRNPLGGIELFAGLLGEEIGIQHQTQLEKVAKIRNEVENLKLTIEQFLDYARETPPQPEMVKSQPFLEDLIHAIQLEANQRKIELSLVNVFNDATTPAPKTIYIDQRLVKSALLNMLHNSLQSITMNKERLDREKIGGKISLTLEPSFHDTHLGYLIRIQDNGVGIPPENIEHLFRPFFTTKEKGCGLGLAFCHKIIHSHGGHIRVESSPGVQTSMSIWLPEKKIASL